MKLLFYNRSVKEYCRWMIEHPEYKRAPYLCSLGLFDSAVLEARLTYEYGQELALMPRSAIFNTEPVPEREPIENLGHRLSLKTNINQ